MSEQGARELHEHRNDPDEWEDQAVEIEVRPAPSAVVSFRIPNEELHRVSEAARAAGESLSEYVREALRVRLEPPAAVTAKEFTGGPLVRALFFSHYSSIVRTAPGTVSTYFRDFGLVPEPVTATSCEGAVAVH